MAAIRIDINRLLKDLNISQESLDNIISTCLRRSCEKIVARAKKNHPSWESKTHSLENAVMFQVHKKKRLAYVFVRTSKLAKNGNGEIVPYYEYLRFGTGLYGKHHSYIYPRKKRAMAFTYHGKYLIVKRTRGIRGDDWLKRARNGVSVSKIFREVLAEAYGTAAVK